MSKSANIGLKNLVYCEITNGVYGAVTSLAPIVDAKIKVNQEAADMYADNRLVETYNSISSYEVEMNVQALELSDVATLIGYSYDAGTNTVVYTNEVPSKYFAIGFASNKADGTWRGVWLTKSQLVLSDEEFTTQGEKIEFKPTKLTIKAMPDDNNIIKIVRDGTESEVVTTFLGTPPGYTADAVAPTVSTVPADAANNVAIDANVVFTFDKAINPNDVKAANFFLMKADGTAVAAALSIGTNNTVVTLNPSSNLSNSTDYVAIATVGVHSAQGVAMAANKVTNFTTVAP